MSKSKKENVAFNASVHGQQLKKFIKQASDIKFQIESSNEAIKDIRNEAKETMGLNPQEFNKLLKIYYTQTREEIEEQNDELLGVYDAVFTD